MADSLIKQFREAGLVLEMAREPFARNNADVFGMDIQRKTKGNKRFEVFRIWRGHKDNRVIVTNKDKKLRQLVLLVHEPSRTFKEEIPQNVVKNYIRRHDDRWLEKLLRDYMATLKDLVRASKRVPEVIIRRSTPDTKRHYLCGVDERQLFIAQLSEGRSTVAAAHESLKPHRVQFAEGKMRTTRQGEWFFLETTQAERNFCEAMLKKGIVKKKTRIGSGGHPHTADELIIVPSLNVLEHGWPVRDNDRFVRGAVRHVDHKTVSFRQWRKVIRNREAGANVGGARQGQGVFWID